MKLVRLSSKPLPLGASYQPFQIRFAETSPEHKNPRGRITAKCMVKTLVNLSLGMVLQEHLICEIVLAHAI